MGICVQLNHGEETTVLRLWRKCEMLTECQVEILLNKLNAEKNVFVCSCWHLKTNPRRAGAVSRAVEVELRRASEPSS